VTCDNVKLQVEKGNIGRNFNCHHRVQGARLDYSCNAKCRKHKCAIQQQKRTYLLCISRPGSGRGSGWVNGEYFRCQPFHRTARATTNPKPTHSPNRLPDSTAHPTQSPTHPPNDRRAAAAAEPQPRRAASAASGRGHSEKYGKRKPGDAL
jgi:hypothetical protein